MASAGPLAGRRVVELAGIGPGPFAAMMLADMGADVLRIERAAAAATGDPESARGEILNRGRRSVAIDLKQPAGRDAVLRLCETADALIEGFRPGVTERLGLGPADCLGRNPRLVYGRMTGWGQEGPLASAAGHDIDYIAIAGALHAIGRAGGPPVPPNNLIGDFGGGGMLLAFGVVCAMVSAQATGVGQVVDAAMVDGAAVLMSMCHGFLARGLWNEERGTNMLDGGAPFYDVYETADHKYVAVGALEPQFYAELIDRLGLGDAGLPAQTDLSGWAQLREALTRAFLARTRAEWAEVFEGSDACVAPVLSMREAAEHPHNRHRGTFVEVDGVVQAAPAPRFSATPTALERPPSAPGEQTREGLLAWGWPAADVDALIASGAAAERGRG